MKKKITVIILSATLALLVVSVGFSAWTDQLQIGFSMTTADKFQLESTEKTSTAQEKTSTAQEKTSTAQEKTSKAQEKTSTVPEKMSTAPEKTSTAPEKTSITDENQNPSIDTK